MKKIEVVEYVISCLNRSRDLEYIRDGVWLCFGLCSEIRNNGLYTEFERGQWTRIA